MLPRKWLTNGTVLPMLDDSDRNEVLFVLAMHSRCNLDVHVDALGTAVYYHARYGTKLVLVWPPTRENLECLGRSLLKGEGKRPLDAIRPFTDGEAHLLRAGERLIIAPLAIHMVLNLTPALSVGVNFNCPSSVALLKHLNATSSASSASLRNQAWYKVLLRDQVCIGLPHNTPAHLDKTLQHTAHLDTLH
mmetsp:Transcript_8276/g.26472  ORF Transcript_8276/g.26472 Transcript_8276/m.26472 type:complete len:191 (+) Transcript_8276:431-1003(+)